MTTIAAPSSPAHPSPTASIPPVVKMQSAESATASRNGDDADCENMLERELEAEICQRFVRLSCEKMLASRNSRGGARLHRNLLILHLLRKARNSTKMWVLDFKNVNVDF